MPSGKLQTFYRVIYISLWNYVVPAVCNTYASQAMVLFYLLLMLYRDPIGNLARLVQANVGRPTMTAPGMALKSSEASHAQVNIPSRVIHCCHRLDM